MFTKFEESYFGVVDYCVFALMVVGSSLVGVYYGYWKEPKDTLAPTFAEMTPEDMAKKQHFGSQVMSEYLLGSEKMKIFPVAMSLLGSYISPVTILGSPPEMYNYGTQQWMVVISIAVSSVIVVLVYLPVFIKLRVDSSYEYLEMRFQPVIRTITSFIFVMDEIFFLPMVLYVPAICLNQASGINIYITSSVMCGLCVLYTLVGGMKAVVHTDAWQVYVMFISVVVVVIVGTIEVGGIGEAFSEAEDGGRLIFANLNPSLYERYTLWSVLFGNLTYWTSFNSVNQTMVQRYMSLPNYKRACQSIAIFTASIMIFVSMCYYGGVIIYAYYRHCDPLSAGLVVKDDQVFPLFVQQTAGWLYGVPGLFMAGVFGAALSSLSVVLNSTALVIFEDIAKGAFKIELTERTSTILVKSTIVVLGFVAFALVFVIDMLGSIFSVATVLTAIAASTSFGLFTLGMLVPWCNTKGAVAGAIGGMVVSIWISFGTQAVQAAEMVKPLKMDVLTDQCPTNVSVPVIVYPDESDVFPLYRLSYLWVSTSGVISVVVIGTIFSFLTGHTKVRDLNPDLISPVMHWCLPKEK